MFLKKFFFPLFGAKPASLMKPIQLSADYQRMKKEAILFLVEEKFTLLVGSVTLLWVPKHQLNCATNGWQKKKLKTDDHE